MPLRDLNSVAATCHRFRDIVFNDVYRSNSSLKRFDIAAMGWRQLARDMEYKVARIKGYLEHFGRFIDHIDFDKNYLEEAAGKFIAFIADNCSNSLKSLKLLNVNLNMETISSGRSIFENLTKLETDHLSNWNEIFPFCVNLVELCLVGNDRPASTNIATFKIRGGTIDAAIIEGFGHCHHLRYLEITVSISFLNEYDESTSEIVWQELHQLNQLTELRLSGVHSKDAGNFLKYLTGAR